MAMQSLKSDRRSEAGKSVARKLRRSGRIPAVYYGRGEAPIPITIGLKELEEIIQRQLWIPLECVAITVEDGHARVTGAVDTRTEAELVAAFASRVPGVVDVQSELEWREDDLKRRLRVPALPSRI